MKNLVIDIDKTLTLGDIKKYNLYLPMQPGDVTMTFADTTDLEKNFKYKPKTTIKEGINSFVKWYTNYNKIK